MAQINFRVGGSIKQDAIMEVRKQKLTRYILPLREGGSLPGLGEADDGFRYAVKMLGSGHGRKSLIAEFLGGMLAKAFKFSVPEIVLLELDSLFGITEPDYEVQQLLRKSEGLNVGLHFLDRALTYEPSINRIDELTASKIVWFDAFIENIDRSRMNPNMMMWNNGLWLIDHGSSFYFQHTDKSIEQAALDPFPYINKHVLLPQATRLEEADRLMRQAITPRTIAKIVEQLPDEWLLDEGETDTNLAASRREDYLTFLLERLKNSSIFVQRAVEERDKLRNSL